MSKVFVCVNCNRKKPINPKLKGNQRYCGDIRCQRARKAAWQKNKMKTDAAYHQSQDEAVQRWRKNKPAHQYQTQYRNDHPEYVEQNRIKQRIRNRQRAERLAASMIVKMDALTVNEPITYAMTPLEKNSFGKIVKMDTLLVQLQRYQAIQAVHQSTFP